MRKILAILLALAMTLSLCACGKDKKSAEDISETETAEETVTENETAAEETPEEADTEEAALDPEAIAAELAGSYLGKIYGVFDMELSIYPDLTGYFVPLYTEDGELIKACEYKLGDENNLYMTLDGETYQGSYDLTAGVVVIRYEDEDIVYSKTDADHESLYARYQEIIAQAYADDGNTEPLLYAKTIENINIRNGAGTEFEKIDKLMADTETEIFQIVTRGDGYTWYRIGEDRWIADDGTWLDICTVDEYAEGYFAEETTEDPAEEPAETPAEGSAEQHGANPADPSTDPGFEIVHDPLAPYAPMTYDGQEQTILAEVKQGISCLTQFESIYPADHRDAVHYWDWEIKKVDESTWSVGLLNAEGTAPQYEYTCTVKYDGTNYTVSDIIDNWAQQH